MWLLFFLITLFALNLSEAKEYPVPIPLGGRTDVHGWLILPIDQPISNDNSTVQAVHAWFSHHVPEFWTDSPHNFQIILKGSLMPTSCVEGELYPIDIPHPPADVLINYEYSFTPPSPFSLNNLLNGNIKKLNGMFYNGSFDTPYERIPQSLSTLTIEQLTTTLYLDEFEKNSFPHLRYLSYPRSLMPSASGHFYFAHEIHAQPDFDHVVHGIVGDCSSSTSADIVSILSRPGSSWEVIGTPNTLEYKLQAEQVGNSFLAISFKLFCKM